VRVWALKGAEQRLVEIGEEAKAIFRNFPELRDKGRGFDTDGAAARQQAPARRRPRLTAEARKRISEAVKARWARQKAGKTEEGAAPPKTVRREATQHQVARKKSRRSGPRAMSAAARKRISMAQKARWAKLKTRKTEGGSEQAAASKAGRARGSRKK
jgi:hypothetical protein